MNDATNSNFRITPRLIVGLGILTLGILWTLDNLDIFEADHLLQYWPVVLILIGLVRLLDRHAGKFSSVILIGIGTLFLLDNLALIEFDIFELFPLIFAVIGLKRVWEAVQRRDAARLSERDPGKHLTAFAMMSGVKRQIVSKEFRGGDATAMMGGVELDLREASIKDGEAAVLDVFVMMGGIELQVPENWVIDSHVLPLMGGFEDKTRPPREPGPRLIIKGMVVFGAVEVKN
jgi:predicted membrane protein